MIGRSEEPQRIPKMKRIYDHNDHKNEDKNEDGKENENENEKDKENENENDDIIVTGRFQLHPSLTKTKPLSAAIQKPLQIPKPIDEPTFDIPTLDDDELFGENFSLFGSPLHEEIEEEDPIPFMYIAQPDKPPIVYLKAYVMRVVKGSFLVSQEYTMRVVIEDGTGAVNARLSHQIIERLIGLSTEEYQQYQVDSAKKIILQESLKAFELKLRDLEGLFEIQDCDGEDPVLLDVLPCTSENLGKFLRRQRTHIKN
eukprot:TRINITY_DN6151_c0_g1_i4.p1 TRINITY_DN6151_c0_g1~~TRINITY_DN6151_c0_g1_i4.p1  ORF type:complete len:256 (+),score=41.09 TRINITY_DN6151_c0_g1_i4:557-1324(+)